MNELPEFVEAWLRDFSAAVRNKDFASGKRLFNDGGVSFGTVCFWANGLEELVSHQWQVVWPRTADFDFEYHTARASLESEQAVVASGWTSKGFNANKVPYFRRGRATLVLR